MEQILCYITLFTFNFFVIKWIGIYFNLFGFNYKIFINFLLKINSIIHSIFILYKSHIFLNLQKDNCNICTENFIKSLEFSKAYLIIDILLTIWYYKKIPNIKTILLHHLLFLLLLHTSILHIYPHIVAQALMCEITNFFLYFGWFLVKKKKTNNIFFILNALILLFLFLIYRVLNFTNLFIISLTIKEIYIERYFALILALMNSYWFIKLLEKFFSSIKKEF